MRRFVIVAAMVGRQVRVQARKAQKGGVDS